MTQSHRVAPRQKDRPINFRRLYTCADGFAGSILIKLNEVGEHASQPQQADADYDRQYLWRIEPLLKRGFVRRSTGRGSTGRTRMFEAARLFGSSFFLADLKLTT